MSVQYAIPDYVRVSKECRHLISCIFVANPAKRISISEIKQHLWFRKNLPREIIEAERRGYEETQKDQPSQSVEEIMRIIQEARTKIHTGEQAGTGTSDAVHGDEANEEVDINDHYAKYLALN
ncbi:Serine/threonine-protein kinase SRK2A [Glycine soja]